MTRRLERSWEYVDGIYYNKPLDGDMNIIVECDILSYYDTVNGEVSVPIGVLNEAVLCYMMGWGELQRVLVEFVLDMECGCVDELGWE